MPVNVLYCLTIIFCKCKSGCGGNCGCRKTELFCTQACGNCNGETCSNCPPTISDENEIEEDETGENI
jgi:hypothetical protein